MCCFMHRADVPDDSPTRILVAELNHPEEERITVVGYENSILNLHSGPNCMMLLVHASEKIEGKDLLDFSKYPQILSNMSHRVFPPKLSRGIHDGLYGSARIASAMPAFAEVHKYTDSCTVVIANSPTSVPFVLEQVEENRRPTINREVLEPLEAMYPGWHLLLFCFKGNVGSQAVFFKYKPAASEFGWLRFPALDSHNGKAAKLGSMVSTNHHLFASWPEMKDGLHMLYGDMPEELKAYLPNSIVGSDPKGRYPNGDFGMRKDNSLIHLGRVYPNNLLRLGPEGPVERREAVLSH